MTNVTPFAEMNIFTDPEAANVALQVKNIEIIMVMLDATHQIHLTEEQFQKIKGSKFKDDLHENLRYYQNSYINIGKMDFVPCHDDFTLVFSINHYFSII